MRALLFGDVHLAPRGPASRIDDYAQAILAKLKRVAELSFEHSVDASFCMGDLFHHKDPGRTPHWLVLETIRILRQFKQRPYLILGNHDLQSVGPESLWKQPVGILVESGELLRNDRPLLFDGGRVQFRLVDYHPEMESHLLALPREEDSRGGSTHILLTHAAITEDPRYGGIEPARLSDKGFHLIAWGHMHQRLPLLMAGNTMFCSVPAVSRGSIPTERIHPIPAVILLDTEGQDNGHFKLTTIDLPCASVEEVFRLEDHLLRRATEDQLKIFVSSVSDLQLKSGSIASAVERIKGTLEPDIYALLMEYLETV